MIVVAVLIGVFLAGHAMTTTTTVNPSAADLGYALVEARAGQVESSYSTSGTLAWTVSARMDVPAQGRVTKTIAATGATVSPGQVLLAVDGRPVVAVAGKIPAYRDLKPGTSGPDVAAWQQFLRQSGRQSVPTGGTFDVATQAATRQWLSAIGIDGDGTVPLGTVVFLPGTPARVEPDQALRLGAQLPSPAFAILNPDPTLTLAVTSVMAAVIKPGVKVSMTVADRTVTSTITGPASPSTSGELRVPVDAAPLQCDRTSCPGTSTAPATVQATIEVVPRTSGIVVPTTAVSTAAGGSPQVTLADGSIHRVGLGPSSDGLIVITTGLSAGDKVRVPTLGS